MQKNVMLGILIILFGIIVVLPMTISCVICGITINDLIPGGIVVIIGLIAIFYKKLVNLIKKKK
jgi:hypothetical protein